MYIFVAVSRVFNYLVENQDLNICKWGQIFSNLFWTWFCVFWM